MFPLSTDMRFFIYLVCLCRLIFLGLVEKCKNKTWEKIHQKKNLAHSEHKEDNLDVIGVIKKVYQPLLLVKERLPDLVYRNSDEWGDDKLEGKLDDIDWLCEKYQ